MSLQPIGRNCSYEVVGDELVIRMKLSAEKERTASGKSLSLATTNGWMKVYVKDAFIKIGLNVLVSGS